MKSHGIASHGFWRLMFYWLQFSWGLPVNLLGALVFLRYRKNPHHWFCNALVTDVPGDWGGLSLGIFVFVSIADPHDRKDLLVHEYGHTVQCLLLGPLYYLAVMLPSALWYHFSAEFRRKRQISYYSLYCERWADRWGEHWSGLKKSHNR